MIVSAIRMKMAHTCPRLLRVDVGHRWLRIRMDADYDSASGFSAGVPLAEVSGEAGGNETMQFRERGGIGGGGGLKPKFHGRNVRR
jgi:hypothetical protein